MGKLFRAFLLSSLFGVSATSIEPNPPAAHEVVARAREGRATLIAAVSDLKRFIPILDRREKLFAYLEILPELEKIEAQYDFETLGSRPVSSLTTLLTKYGAKWIDLDTVEWGTVKLFFTYADNPTRYSVVSQQSKRVFAVTVPKDLLAWHEKTTRLHALNMALGSEAFVIEKLEELQGALVRRVLSTKTELDSSILSALVESTTAVPAIQEVLEYLRQRVGSTNEPETLRQLLTWTLTLTENLRNRGEAVSAVALRQPAPILQDGHRRLLAGGKSLPVSQLDRFVGAFGAADLGTFVDNLNALFENRPLPAELVEPLWELSVRLAKSLVKFNDRPRLLELERLHQRLAALRLQKNGNFEGTYLVTVGDAERGERVDNAILTIAAIGASNFSMALNILYDPGAGHYGADFNFFNVVYDLPRQHYRAQYRAVEEPRYLVREEHHHHAHFNLAQREDGKYGIEGRFLDGTLPLGYRTFRGKQHDTYPSFPEAAGAPAENFEGTYRAVVAGRAHELVITKTGSSIGGKYFWLPGDRRGISFEWGFHNPLSNSIHLTSGELAGSKKWFHLRGVFSKEGDSIDIIFIRSGSGVAHSVTLQRVK